MRTVKVEVWDDLDHEVPATQTRKLCVDGVWLELDLGDVNGKALDAALEPYKASAGRTWGTPESTAIREREAPFSGASRKLSLSQTRKRNERVRAWASQQTDLKLPQSFADGYIPKTAYEGYALAHPEDPA